MLFILSPDSVLGPVLLSDYVHFCYPTASEGG